MITQVNLGIITEQVQEKNVVETKRYSTLELGKISEPFPLHATKELTSYHPTLTEAFSSLDSFNTIASFGWVKNEVVEGIDFDFLYVIDTTFENITFRKCEFNFTTFERCVFKNVKFEDCTFYGEYCGTKTVKEHGYCEDAFHCGTTFVYCKTLYGYSPKGGILVQRKISDEAGWLYSWNGAYWMQPFYQRHAARVMSKHMTEQSLICVGSNLALANRYVQMMVDDKAEIIFKKLSYAEY